MTETQPTPRRHDLDALRAFAMLLGIALHAGLSFTPFPWVVQDPDQNPLFGLFFAAVHGFRMPLFFLLSGFFTAMLWRRRGLAGLLRHRAKRILAPCLLGLVTIVPALQWSFSWATDYAAAIETVTPSAEIATLAEAARLGDGEAVRRLLAEGADPEARDARLQATPLAWAAMRGNAEITKRLLEAGADVDLRNGDGGSALHGAAFLGHAEVARVLLDAGADPAAVNDRGDTPLDTTRADWATTEFVASLLRVPLGEKDAVEAGRSAIAERLRSLVDAASAETASDPSASPVDEPTSFDPRAAYAAWLMSDRWAIARFWTDEDGDTFNVMTEPIFYHLWFLWLLLWLVAAFALWAAAGAGAPPRNAIVSWKRWLWLTPATLAPQWFMGIEAPTFGPDTSLGLLPWPHVLAYYGVFFFYGAWYYDADDSVGRVGRGWRWTLPVTLLLVFPVGLGLTFTAQRPAADLAQVVYAWAMGFGMIGLFRRVLRTESRTIRYLSDSSYWLYLAHLPLVIVLQALVAGWRGPASVKFLGVVAVATAILLASYQTLVRHTFVGRLLNGPRRPRPAAVEPRPAAESPLA